MGTDKHHFFRPSKYSLYQLDTETLYMLYPRILKKKSGSIVIVTNVYVHILYEWIWSDLNEFELSMIWDSIFPY